MMQSSNGPQSSFTQRYSYSELNKAVKNCLETIAEREKDNTYSGELSGASLSELRQQYGIWLSDVEKVREPIRTVHHFACTGGTLISKCLASMPNTQLLSEVEPHSHMVPSTGQKFYPTDLIALLRVGSKRSHKSLETQIFLAGLSVVYSDCARRGLRLVLRDHAHSKYCLGSEVSKESSLHEMISQEYAVKSITTVRHPIDSYASLVNNRWLHFQPQTPEEYSLRYLRFLSDHRHLRTFKYEDIIESPTCAIREVCEELNMPFNENFVELFNVHSFSGDSGRSSATIEQRERREISEEIKSLFDKSPSYHQLCEQLGYEHGGG